MNVCGREHTLEEKLFLVMPAYNEEASIEEVVRGWYTAVEQVGPASRLVVADEGSTDNTHAILCRLQEELPQLCLLANTGKQHGPKLMALYRNALEQGATYIFQTDSDGQTNPEEFPAFWKSRKEYAGLFGNRRMRGDGLMRRLAERVVCWLLRCYFGVRVPDANAPFRLMQAEPLAQYLPKLPDDYALPNIMLTAFFVHDHQPVAFRKISFRSRQTGKSSIHLSRMIVIGRQALRDFHRFKKEM